MQVEPGTLQGDLAVAHAAQPRGDARRIDVPHIGVADQREIGGERFPCWQRGTVQGSGCRSPPRPPAAWSRGRECRRRPPSRRASASTNIINCPLSSTAPRATTRAPCGPSTICGSKGGLCPKLERIRRLHIVVPVEQNTWRPRASGAGMMPEHDRMPGSRLDRDLESKTCKLVTEPLSRLLHIRLVHGLRADARNTQQAEQTLAGLIQILIHPSEHSTDHIVRIGAHEVTTLQTTYLISSVSHTRKLPPDFWHDLARRSSAQW